MKEKLDVLNSMTLEEKAMIIGGVSSFGSYEIEHLDVPRIQYLDGGTGINFEQLFGDFAQKHVDTNSVNGMSGHQILTAVWQHFYEPECLDEDAYAFYKDMKGWLDEWTGMPDMAPGCYPPGILLGATFSPETVRCVGEALGREATIYHVDYLLGTPNVNLLRDPKNGRIFEGYSEDPCLVSTLAPELVKGVQEYPVVANVKHFAANNQETNRIGINEIISKRALYELYLPGFKACVEAGVQSVMSAYNKINGVACTQNTWLLHDVLRDEWGFEGAVVSDWGAVYDQVQAILSGNDLNMPGPVDPQPIIDAVKSGRLPEEDLDLAVYHFLSTISFIKKKKEHFDASINNNDNVKEIKEKTDAVAYEAAKEGIILLKNENQIFPIRPEQNCKVAVIGSGSRHMLSCGTGSAGITTNRNTELVPELVTLLGEEQLCLANDAQTAMSCDVVLVVASLQGQEGNDRKDIFLDSSDEELLRQLIADKQNKNFKLGLILNVCGPVDLTEFVENIDGIFCTFLPGMQGARALAKLVCGLENPSGKLPITFPKRDQDTPTYINFPGDGGQVVYGEGIFVGYRYYDKKDVSPLYPFGYGLSYTDFKIENCNVDAERFKTSVTVNGSITNTGSVAGAQVVQLYISDVVSSQTKPVKELKKFAKIYLQPGETKTFTFKLSEEDFEYYDMDYERFLCEEGYYDIIIATSSAKEDVASVLRVYKEGKSPYSYGLNSTMKVLFEEPNIKEALLAWWDAEQLDAGILYSTYQYANNKRLRDIVPEGVCCEEMSNADYKHFVDVLSCIEKP